MKDDDLDTARGMVWACLAGLILYVAAAIAWNVL